MNSYVSCVRSDRWCVTCASLYSPLPFYLSAVSLSLSRSLLVTLYLSLIRCLTTFLCISRRAGCSQVQQFVVSRMCQLECQICALVCQLVCQVCQLVCQGCQLVCYVIPFFVALAAFRFLDTGSQPSGVPDINCACARVGACVCACAGVRACACAHACLRTCELW